MTRAIAANALMGLAYETTYGVAPGGNMIQLPFSPPSQIGAEQALVADDTLGRGRNKGDPSQDAVNATGKITVPWDGRNIGYWLKLIFGAPTTAAVAASAMIAFSANPAVGATLTLNGTVWTIVASGASGNQINRGANTNATVTAIAAALEASSETETVKCDYAAATNVLTITYKTTGSAGNAFTLAASADAAATLSSAKLVGGGNKHTFASGASALPSASIQIANPDVSVYALNTGCQGNVLDLTAGPTGNLNATIDLINQNEVVGASDASGTPAVNLMTRFANAKGQVLRDGVALGEVTSAQFTYDNKMEPARNIDPNGLISGVDLGVPECSIKLTLRFTDLTMLNLATNLTPVEIAMQWSNADGDTLKITLHRVFMPRPQRPLQGPGGIQTTYDGQAVTDPTAGKICTVELVNDMANYDNAA